MKCNYSPADHALRKLRELPRIAVVAMLMLSATSGCGKSTGQQEISGTVTVNGTPLAEGAIRFQPKGGGIASGTTIKEGKFHVSADQGPTPGSFKVEISSYRSTGKKKPDPDNPGAMLDDLRQFIPAEYNSATTLTAEVTAGGENQFEYDLKIVEATP